jgi:hypothetical protein
MKPKFLLSIEFSDIFNCSTFSAVPSMINEKLKKSRAVRVRSHTQFGSNDFAEQCNFNRNPPIFSNRHRWRQLQHVMFPRLGKHHFTGAKYFAVQASGCSISAGF